MWSTNTSGSSTDLASFVDANKWDSDSDSDSETFRDCVGFNKSTWSILFVISEGLEWSQLNYIKNVI